MEYDYDHEDWCTKNVKMKGSVSSKSEKSRSEIEIYNPPYRAESSAPDLPCFAPPMAS